MPEHFRVETREGTRGSGGWEPGSGTVSRLGQDHDRVVGRAGGRVVPQLSESRLGSDSEDSDKADG